MKVFHSLFLAGAFLLHVDVNAQSFTWDFEGPNGLDGWARSDGSFVQTEPGLASNTCMRMNTGGTDPVELFYYHEIPFSPTMGYDLTWWTKINYSGGFLPDLRILVSWVYESPGSPASAQLLDQYFFYTNGSNNPVWVGNGTMRWFGTSNDFSSDPNAHFCVVLMANSTNAASTWIDNVTVNIGDLNAAHLSLQGMLGGAMDGLSGQMREDLVADGLVPLQEPYSALGYPQVGGGGETTFPEAMAAQSGLFINVDWVRIELRSALNPAVVVATKQVLINQPGWANAASGNSWLIFDVPTGDYYVALRHRNHLGCMTAVPVTLGDALDVGYVNFKDTTATWGTEARDTSTYPAKLWPGDVNGDGKVKYVGANNDRDHVLMAIGGVNPLNTVPNTYDTDDVNMDGTIKYAGAGNDRDVILQTIEGIPTNTRQEQIP